MKEFNNLAQQNKILRTKIQMSALCPVDKMNQKGVKISVFTLMNKSILTVMSSYKAFINKKPVFVNKI